MADATPKKTVVTTPDYALSEKIGKDVDLNTIFTEDRIKASEAEVVKVQESFLDNIQVKLNEMHKVFADKPDQAQTKDTLISHSFMMKGQAESLGYSLLSHVAKSLCEYCEEHYSSDVEHRHTIVTKHLNTMQVVIKDKIKGDGGALGAELVEKLKLLIAKYHGR